jgi:hypothetical protein
MNYSIYATHFERSLAMNRSEVLKALEWVDQTAREGDSLRLEKAKLALEDVLNSPKTVTGPEDAYRTAVASFARKHGREPLEDIEEE